MPTGDDSRNCNQDTLTEAQNNSLLLNLYVTMKFYMLHNYYVNLHAYTYVSIHSNK